jgi:DNA-binding transcriptional LysR family regulator
VQLAELGREAGTKLLRRVGRNVELTPAGRRLAAYAEQALAADEAVRTELAGLGDAPRGRLRMAFVQTPALALLPGVLARLAEAAPDLQVDVV